VAVSFHQVTLKKFQGIYTILFPTLILIIIIVTIINNNNIIIIVFFVINLIRFLLILPIYLASRRCSQQASPPVVSYHSTSSLAIPVKPPRRGSSDSNKVDEGQIASRIRLQSQLLQKFDIRVPDHYLTDSSNPSSIASSPANSYS